MAGGRGGGGGKDPINPGTHAPAHTPPSQACSQARPQWGDGRDRPASTPAKIISGLYDNRDHPPLSPYTDLDSLDRTATSSTSPPQRHRQSPRAPTTSRQRAARPLSPGSQRVLDPGTVPVQPNPVRPDRGPRPTPPGRATMTRPSIVRAGTFVKRPPLLLLLAPCSQ